MINTFNQNIVFCFFQEKFFFYFLSGMPRDLVVAASCFETWWTSFTIVDGGEGRFLLVALNEEAKTFGRSCISDGRVNTKNIIFNYLEGISVLYSRGEDLMIVTSGHTT